MVDKVTQANARADVADAFHVGIVGHVVAVGVAHAGSCGRRRVAPKLVPARLDVVCEAIDVDARGPGSEAVGELNLDALADVAADRKRLDWVVAQANRDVLARFLDADFRLLAGGDKVRPLAITHRTTAGGIAVAGEHHHLAERVVVAEAVEGHVNVDRLDAVVADRCSIRARARPRARGDGEGREGEANHAK